MKYLPTLAHAVVYDVELVINQTRTKRVVSYALPVTSPLTIRCVNYARLDHSQLRKEVHHAVHAHAEPKL